MNTLHGLRVLYRQDNWGHRKTLISIVQQKRQRETPVAGNHRWAKGIEGLAGGYFSDDRSSKKAIMGVRINNAEPIPITPMVPISVLWCTW